MKLLFQPMFSGQYLIAVFQDTFPLCMVGVEVLF